jgi:hypothetical protein
VLAAVVVATAAGAALGLAASGFVKRHADTGPRAAGLLHWFAPQPGWRDDGSEATLTSSSLAPLAGDRLQHPVQLLEQRASCAQVEQARRRGWLVVETGPSTASTTAPACLGGQRPDYADRDYRVYSGRAR